MSIFWAIAAGCFNSLTGVISKQAEQSQCRPGPFALLFMGTVSVESAIMLVFIGGKWGPPQLWLLTVVMGGLYILATRSMISANQSFPPSLVWMLANVALVVPVGLAPLLLRENWHTMDWAIIAAFAALLWTSRRGMEPDRPTAKPRGLNGLPSLMVVFLGNGLLMLGYKLKGVYWPDVGAAPFALLVFGSGFLVGLLLHFRHGYALDIKPAEWKWGMSVGAAAAAANLSLLGAVSLPAVVVFPVIQGIGLGGGVLLMFLLYHERLNAWKVAGFVLAMSILVLALIR
jgi:drug/metabolite transporter (DMT)-like permease